MVENAFKYENENPFVEGTSERPSRVRPMWKITQTEAVGTTYIDPDLKDDDDEEDGPELFILTQEVVGSFERSAELEEYQTVYVPRPANYPPIQKVTLKYLDKSGSMQDAIRRDKDEHRR